MYPKNLLIVLILGAVAGAPLTAAAETQARVSLPVLKLDSALDAATDLPRMHSLLVSWRGQVVVERYFNGVKPTRLANIKSASKSVISALVGIAIDRGLIPDVKQPIASYFPDLPSLKDPVRQKITIEDLLTMRSGLETTSNRNYGQWVLSNNWVRHALSRRLISTPGTLMEYSTGNTHLLSAILTKATGKNTWQFAQEVLARPMGFSLAPWPRDPQGIFFGGNDMLMTPRQMLAFGEMYLNKGRVNSRQVIPAAWVEATQIARTQSRRENDRHYGYGWWIRELGGHQTYYAWGFGGQYIFVVPDLELVVVTTSASDVGEGRMTHRRTVYDMVEHFIIQPVSAVN
jgi:CubicO group peptidase (beta-lactamase class C family)